MISILLALRLAAAAHAPLPPHHAPDSLAALLRERIRADTDTRVAVATWRLGAGADSLFINANWTFHAASTMKVPVMVQLFRMVDAGRLSLAESLVVRNRFTSIADGSSYALDLADDSDSSLYARVGQRTTVGDLLQLMITRSSNLATNILITLTDPAKVTATMHELGAAHLRVLRGVEDGPAFRAGLNNTVTAHDLAILMAAIAEDRAASPASCEAMRRILFAQEFHDEIPAGLPKGTPVAHKTGWVDGRVLHDAAIIYPRGGRPYVLVVLTGETPSMPPAQRLIADLSRLVWQSEVGPGTPH